MRALCVPRALTDAFRAKTVSGCTDDVATGLAALHWRESHVVKRLQATLASTMKSTGMSSEDAWNAHVDLVVDAGKAHVESLVARKFAEFVDAPAAAPLREVLTPVLLMFLHHVITQDLGYFVSHEGISYARAFACLRTRTLMARATRAGRRWAAATTRASASTAPRCTRSRCASRVRVRSCGSLLCMLTE